jgi:hypothetical protein
VRWEGAEVATRWAWVQVNHFAEAKQLTRKDLLKKHLARYQVMHSTGKWGAFFSILPTTFTLPKVRGPLGPVAQGPPCIPPRCTRRPLHSAPLQRTMLACNAACTAHTADGPSCCLVTLSTIMGGGCNWCAAVGHAVVADQHLQPARLQQHCTHGGVMLIHCYQQRRNVMAHGRQASSMDG